MWNRDLEDPGVLSVVEGAASIVAALLKSRPLPLLLARRHGGRAVVGIGVVGCLEEMAPQECARCEREMR
jgi:hypothetical protein